MGTMGLNERLVRDMKKPPRIAHAEDMGPVARIAIPPPQSRMESRKERMQRTRWFGASTDPS